ncbi:MAG: transglutaminase domain-containing protein, partial [Dehalococcoidia bacterium]
MRGRKITLQISLCLVLLLLAMSLVMACPPPSLPPPQDSTSVVEPEPEITPIFPEIEPPELEPPPVEIEPMPVVIPLPEPVVTPIFPEIEPPEPILVPIPGSRDILERVNFELIDQHALDAPEWAEESVESLAAWLVEPARNDLEKVRAIFRWITHNVYYDVVTFFNIIEGTGPVADQSPEGVLASREAVCEGYSRLFKALAHLGGLEVVQVSGWAKGFGYTVGDPIEGPADHAWNAVKIDDGWYLLDSTWGAGSLDEERQFVRKFKEFFFLTPPEQLIYTHFPVNPHWQLLEVPITRDEFAEPPLVGPAFFENSLEFVSHPEGVIEVEHSVVVTISAPEDVELLAELEQEGQRLPRSLTFAQREGDHYVIEAVFPGPGDYCLLIFAGKRGETEEFKFAIRYKVIVSEGLPGPIGFP